MDLLIVQLIKVSIVLFEMDVITNVSRSGRFQNERFIPKKKIVPLCCGNTNQNTTSEALKGAGLPKVNMQMTSVLIGH